MWEPYKAFAFQICNLSLLFKDINCSSDSIITSKVILQVSLSHLNTTKFVKNLKTNKKITIVKVTLVVTRLDNTEPMKTCDISACNQ